MQNIYESGIYAEKNPTWHEEDSPWKARQIERMILANKIPHQKIAEIGCGTGDILLNLEKSFHNSTFSGFEVSPQALERAKRKETQRTTFRYGDVTKDTFERFDIALVIDVIEHVEDYVGFIRHMKPIADYTIFHIPLDLSVQSVARRRPIMNLRESVGHIHYFFKDSALSALRDCGYEIVDTRYTASRLELPNQAFSSTLMRWPRRLLHRLSPDLAVRLLGGYSLLVLAR